MLANIAIVIAIVVVINAALANGVRLVDGGRRR